MVDFLVISELHPKRDVVEIYPDFKVGYVKDLMIRGGDFYAFWDEDLGLWRTNEQDLINMVDKELANYYEKNKAKLELFNVSVKYMSVSSSKMIDRWHNYVKNQMRDQYHPLDEKLIFADQKIKKDDYATGSLKYSMSEGSIDNYNELINTLYAPSERKKIEWCIGAILSGDSKDIQKFAVFYGAPGTGKSTVLNIIQMLFEGYYLIFDAEILGNSSASFPLEQFKENKLVAICHDTDLSHIEKNTVLNSLVSHERMTVNEKHKSLYTMRFNSFPLIGTNKFVKITDAKSGIIRRLIDIHPTGNKLKKSIYNQLIKGIEFELGAIAKHCLDLYLNNVNLYDDYVPVMMLGESNDFYNFIIDSYDIFKRDNGVTLKAAWEMYKVYCEEAKVPYPLTMRAFKIELKNYFKSYEERITIDDERIRNYYFGFKTDLIGKEEEPVIIEEKPEKKHLQLKEQESQLDILCADCFAQYATADETPQKKWENVDTTLKDINTKKLHYLKVPENLIVIDFDIKDKEGNKCFEKNEEEALKWPKTYTELSKSGGGIHLHYIYDGDPSMLSRIYGDDIEIKVFTGNSSLRRKLSKCNNEPIAHINSGLPLKEKKVVNFEDIKDEQHLVRLIEKCLRKEIHSATKPNIDYIYKLLEDAYNSGMTYNVSKLKNKVIDFAAHSTNQADYCLKLVTKMHFKSEDIPDNIEDLNIKPICFFDIEVFPNVIFINYKELGKGKHLHHLINPTPKQIEHLISTYRLVGFNCRRYDNHILYAIYIGYNNEQVYQVSKKIIAANGKKADVFFGDAYNWSYTDIYDYCGALNKMSLKKWEIKLKIHHKELGMNWDEPVPVEKWEEVSKYCDNDVISTEAVWEATQEDFRAREILADLAGMTVNDTTNSLTQRIIFGKDKNPELVYTHLDTGEQEGPADQINKCKYINAFPGYSFERYWDPATNKFIRNNMYRGIDLGFGGYVEAEPGIYYDVALLDVRSMHPNSAINMNLFGKYTKNYEDIVNARAYIKHGEYDKVGEMFGGKLKKYLTSPETAKELSTVLKTPINAVYGLTSANFTNAFKDKRNENNIVALRGALFMKTLRDEVINKGFKVAHIKTDSIKIPNATPEIIKFCMDFARQYGYEFEHEATYKKMCLVNDAVYIAKYMTADEATSLYGYSPDDCKKHGGEWTATGTQFAVPYVFKKCFSKEPIDIYDMAETNQVQSAMYLNMNEGHEDENHLKFIGKVGLFCPIKPGCGGGLLVKEQLKKDGSIGLDAVTGSKGYRWLETEDVINKNLKDCIDESYYINLVDKAIEAISQYGDYYAFIS